MANFFYPKTWEIIEHDGAFFRVVTDSRDQGSCLSHLHICPECEAIVRDAEKHLEWHNQNDKE